MPVAPIDIMLPYYGDVSLMQATVRSVLAQDDPNWRLTVVDDGYPDSSIPGWFESLGEPRVRYLRNETNLGANLNYKKCLTLVEHDLMVMMGADDLMHPNYVSTIRAAHADFPDAAMIQPGVTVIDEHDREVTGLVDGAKQRIYQPRFTGRLLLTGEDAARRLLRGNWLYFPSLAWRSEEMVRIGFRDGLDVVQDLALELDLIEQGNSLLLDEQVCFSYRRHSASDSSWRALAGTRFVEERNFFLDEAARMRSHGWTNAERAARQHISSRLNALSLLPKAIRNKQGTGVRNLSRHAFGPSKVV